MKSSIGSAYAWVYELETTRKCGLEHFLSRGILNCVIHVKVFAIFVEYSREKNMVDVVWIGDISMIQTILRNRSTVGNEPLCLRFWCKPGYIACRVMSPMHVTSLLISWRLYDKLVEQITLYPYFFFSRYDFFLVSQSVRQGTVSPTHYNVIEDSSGLTPDHFQRLTYKLTHLYYNWPVSKWTVNRLVFLLIVLLDVLDVFRTLFGKLFLQSSWKLVSATLTSLHRYLYQMWKDLMIFFFLFRAPFVYQLLASTPISWPSS